MTEGLLFGDENVSCGSSVLVEWNATEMVLAAVFNLMGDTGQLYEDHRVSHSTWQPKNHHASASLSLLITKQTVTTHKRSLPTCS